MRYELLFANSPAALILFDNKGEIILSNNAAQRLFEIDEPISAQLNIFDFIPNHLAKLAKTSWESFLDAEQQKGFTVIKTNKENVRYVSYSATANIEPGFHFASLHQIETKKNAPNTSVKKQIEIHLKERALELENINVKLRREISYREQITRELHSSEARYRQLYEIYPVGIFHVDQDRVTTYANPKLAEIEGVTMEELNNGDWAKYIHPEDQERVISSWHQAFKESRPLNINYRFKHGTKITWVNTQTVPEFDDSGKMVGHVGIVSDITRLHEAEEQLKQNQIEIAHFARLHSMGEVASGIAHELNQPLTAISNFMNGAKRRLLSLEKPKIPKDIIIAIDNATTQVQRAGNIIHNLKDFLRKGELSKKKFDLNHAIQDVIIFSKKSVSENKITLKLKLEKNLPPINADKIHIEQVILNIVNNAIDAVNAGKRQTKEIIIRTKLYKKNWVRISIGDSGMGIAKDLIREIFNPFVTTKPEGMGIGLSLCYNIIEKHQGTISVTSQPRKGAIFHITLPIK